MNPILVCIFLLANQKYYVGESSAEISQDPAKCIAIIPTTDVNKLTVQLMIKYGLDNVRGGDYKDLELSADQLSVIKTRMAEYSLGEIPDCIKISDPLVSTPYLLKKSGMDRYSVEIKLIQRSAFTVYSNEKPNQFAITVFEFMNIIKHLTGLDHCISTPDWDRSETFNKWVQTRIIGNTAEPVLTAIVNKLFTKIYMCTNISFSRDFDAGVEQFIINSAIVDDNVILRIDYDGVFIAKFVPISNR